MRMLVLGSLLLAGLSPHSPAPAAVVAEEMCEVTGWSMSWGFKESFRAYVSGAIAGGEWGVAGDVSYSTPLFAVTSSRGQIASDGQSGRLDATGSMTFYGHDGLLDQTLSDPRVIVNGSTAEIVFDVEGDTQAGLSVSATDVGFVSVDISGATIDGDTWSVSGAPTLLTDEGAEAFGTYPAGEPFDPLDLTVDVTPGCLAEGPSGAWFLGLGLGSALTVGVAIVLVRRWRGRERPLSAES